MTRDKEGRHDGRPAPKRTNDKRYKHKERLAKGFGVEKDGRRDRRPALEERIIRKMCDLEERLAKGLTKDGDGRRDGRLAPSRNNSK